MTKTIGRLADRMLGLVVPKATAGACPCNDTVCVPCPNVPGKVRNARYNCNCTKVTYTACYTGPC